MQRDVVDQLVVATLQEGGINRYHRLEAFAGHARSKGHGVLFGNAHVVIALGKALMESHHARALAHGGRDAHQAHVFFGHVTQPLAKHLGEGGFGGRGGRHQAHAGVELAGAMVGHRVGFGLVVALAFFGDHMQKLRAVQVLDVLQRRNERLQVVPVDRADVVEAELLEQRGGHHHAFGVFFQPLGQLEQGRCIFQHILGPGLGRRVKTPAHELGQVAVERPHGRADRHVVVVQDHQQLALFDARVVQRLESHAGRHGAIANHRNRMARFAFLAGRHGHAQSRRNAGGRMRGAEGVVFALVAARKARQAAKLAQRGHAVASPGEDFVRISLVAHIPDDAVFRGVEDIVQSHGQLHRAQVRTQVPTGFGDVVQHAVTQLVGQLGQIGALQAAQVGWGVDGLEQIGHVSCFFLPPWR